MVEQASIIYTVAENYIGAIKLTINIAKAILDCSLLLNAKLSLFIFFAHRKEYKTDTKNEAKRLRATTFAITKLEER